MQVQAAACPAAPQQLGVQTMHSPVSVPDTRGAEARKIEVNNGKTRNTHCIVHGAVRKLFTAADLSQLPLKFTLRIELIGAQLPETDREVELVGYNGNRTFGLRSWSPSKHYNRYACVLFCVYACECAGLPAMQAILGVMTCAFVHLFV